MSYSDFTAWLLFHTEDFSNEKGKVERNFAKKDKGTRINRKTEREMDNPESENIKRDRWRVISSKHCMHLPFSFLPSLHFIHSLTSISVKPFQLNDNTFIHERWWLLLLMQILISDCHSKSIRNVLNKLWHFNILNFVSIPQLKL